MLKIPQKLGRGIAFWRVLDSNTLLGSGTYVQIARFESVDLAPLRGTFEDYLGDSVFVLASDASAYSSEITINNMTFTTPDPSLASQYPTGTWNFFDFFGINYVYQYGAYNLSSYQARAYHMGPSSIHEAPEGMLLIRAYGGSRKRCVEMEFYRVRATELECNLNKESFWLTSVPIKPIVNPAYTAANDPEGLLFTFRDFPQSIKNMGIGA